LSKPLFGAFALPIWQSFGSFWQKEMFLISLTFEFQMFPYLIYGACETTASCPSVLRILG
jgi:hypothetical protein